jgi:tetratricopeptide (TPR) repeat protein
MKKHPNLILGLVFAAVIAVGALQGRHVDNIREATDFYRWILSASTQWRVMGADLQKIAVADEQYDQPGKKHVQWMDNKLFQEVQQRVETAPGLPEVSESPTDVDAQGNLQPKLVRMVEKARLDTSEGDKPAELGEGAGIYDRAIWKLAKGPDLAAQRAEFLKYKRKGQLASLGTAFTAGEIYNKQMVQSIDDQTVSMTQLFFGFRKMAANLLWLQVDKYWHAGMVHRMVPLMKTTVALDPNFVDAFLLGAWHLAYNATAQMTDTPESLKVYSPYYQARIGPKEEFYYQAIDFLKDGIRKNPRNYKLYFDLGFSIYELKLNDFANAVRYLSEAMRYKHDRWVPRQLAIAQQKNGQYADALAGWEAYFKQYPDNPNAPRFIKTNQALLVEEEADKAAEAGNADKAKELRAKARAVWDELVNQEQDPYALMRIRRMDALELAREGRYLEANGLLDQARYETPAHFDVLSDLMIKIKKQGNLPLYLSEKLYLRRKAEDNQFIADELKKITGKIFEIRDDVWYEQGYTNQPTQLLTPGSKELRALRAKHEDLNLILSFRQPVVFQLDNTWYHYRAKVD